MPGARLEKISISIHAPRGGSDAVKQRIIYYFSISIHAPRGGSDKSASCRFPRTGYFNPRSPWGERQPPRRDWLQYRDFNPRSPWGERRCSAVRPWRKRIFQSTLPVGGATGIGVPHASTWLFQSTLPVGGATRLRHPPGPGGPISIHAPRGGSDSVAHRAGQRHGISIHAPRGGSDSGRRVRCLWSHDFNPRSPWGERQQRCTILGAHLWRRYIIFAHFREIGLSAWAASGESGGKQRSKSRANLPGIFCLPGLRNQRIRGASGI